MRFQIHSKSHVLLEPIALADIVINLFVFFFVTFGLFATFDAKQKSLLPIALPQSNRIPSPKTADPLALTMTRGGGLRLGFRPVTLPQLKRAVDYELSMRKGKNIKVQADRAISVQQLVSVLDILRETKAQAISIETESP